MEEKKMLIKEIKTLLKECEDEELIHLVYLILLNAKIKF